MRFSVAARLALGFGLCILVFVAVSIVSYSAVDEMVHASNQRRESFQLLNELNAPVRLLKDIEATTRTYYLTGDARFLDEYRVASEQLQQVLPHLRQLAAHKPRQLEHLNVLEPLVRQRLATVRENIESYRSDGARAVAQRIRSGDIVPLSNEMLRVVDTMAADERDVLRQRIAETDATTRTVQITIVAGTLAAIVLAIVAGWAITRAVANPLRQLTAAAGRICAGETGVALPATTRRDEVGALSEAFARMVQYLRGLAVAAGRMADGDLREPVSPQSEQDVLGTAFAGMSTSLREQIRALADATQVLGGAATQVVASTTQLAASASQSAAAVAQTSATVDEVRQTAEVSAQKAREVSDAARKAAQDALDGRQSSAETGAGMQRIRQEMDAMSSSVAKLSESGHAIGQVIATVEDLAVQSNLLAVNAAIEAAKAGEHGKGFGVVAQEVRSLAAQSRQATAEVRTLLGDIQTAAAAAVAAIQHGQHAVEAGSRQTTVASHAIEALAGSVQQAAEAATQIAASSTQQLVGVDQVAGAMDSIRDATTHNMTSARELESAARNIEGLGQRLQQMVARYAL